MNELGRKLPRATLLADENTSARTLIHILTASGPLERATISARTGWARSHVSALVTRLIRNGLLAEYPSSTYSGRGRPTSVICVAPSAGAVIGLDFGLRHIRGVATDVSHKVLGHYEIEMGHDYAPQDGLSTAARLVQILQEMTGVPKERLLGLGVGIPAPVNRKAGTISTSAIIPLWAGVDIVNELRARTGYRVHIDNESKLAALAESLWGAGQGLDSMIYFKVHSGIGGAFVLGGRLVHGANGGAGEFGHMSIDAEGPICRCGNRGCLELYAGIPAILKALRENLGNTPTVTQVIQGFLDGEPVYRRVLNECAFHCGHTIGQLCNAFNPEAVIIGGRLSQAGPAFLDEIKRNASRATLPINHAVDFRLGTLGDYTSALGAVAAVLMDGL